MPQRILFPITHINTILTPNFFIFAIFFCILFGKRVSSIVDDDVFSEAMDATFSLVSKVSNPSNNSLCVHNIKALMIRNEIPPSLYALRNNLSDAQLMRLGILASIALISPWNQDPQGKFIISDRGVLIEDYHPSSSESDIMLCVVCSLLAIIILFHVTSAQYQYVISKPV